MVEGGHGGWRQEAMTLVGDYGLQSVDLSCLVLQVISLVRSSVNRQCYGNLT